VAEREVDDPQPNIFSDSKSCEQRVRSKDGEIDLCTSAQTLDPPFELQNQGRLTVLS
jgi:hypothetical protein